MPREISFFALLIPSLLPVLVGSALLFIALDLGLSRLGMYRHVWHPALFRASLFTVIFAAAGLWLRP